MEDIIILGIETSCDETSAAVVKNGREVLSNIISSQVDLHAEYGGVVPEIASRKHLELIIPVIDSALNKAGITLEEVDGIAVTYGPGLVGALLVGVSAAKAISAALDKPLIKVHHIEGHVAANYIDHPDLEPPYICLIASGGHSHIVLVKGYLDFKILGRTRDDAAGEAFDKIARVLGLGYPGGPAIDKEARLGNPKAIRFPRVNFPGDSLDFSFSGLKTAVINYVNHARQVGEALNIPDICASFQQAVVDVLTDHTIKAAKAEKVKTIALAGGVAANSLLRHQLEKRAKKAGFECVFPSLVLCTDNAAMIASAGYYSYLAGEYTDLTLNAIPYLQVGEGHKK
ncbi:MAG: tRNA (adenosine(37)-N6)-threonylcarbamoyltransferase complex transferase subunit TsaD [Clostridiaceae bacterium]|jgi:N6-L-threonylcarbamoyladenine synthase|nr:tRNA (adenosine(37)-N6)-threonylcarbamoyltransferase complex transferase subunit TsaD [Clostridiaceae bacterium]